MKRYLILIAFVLVFIPFIAHAETEINEIRITSETTSVETGPLPSYQVETTTEGILISPFGSNTGWLKWENESNSWVGFGLDTPFAYDDGTHYALRILFMAQDATIVNNPTVYFNDVNVTNVGHTEVSILKSEGIVVGAYVMIDLGTATGENQQPFTVTFDSQGGSAVESEKIANGYRANEPNAPTRKLFGFEGWYKDPDCTEAWDFYNDLVTEDTTLYAKWVQEEPIEKVTLIGNVAVGTLTAGELGPFSIAYLPSQHVSVEQYGSNTTWVQKTAGQTNWSGFGSETPHAVSDGTTHYGLRILVDNADGYQITEDTLVEYKVVNVEEEHDVFVDIMPWGAYVYVDLGVVEYQEQPELTFEVEFDYNGGHNGMGAGGTYLHTVAVAPTWTVDYLMDGVTPPDGKELDYILVDGERYDLPCEIFINHNMTVVYMWKDAEGQGGGGESPVNTAIQDITVTGITLPKQGNHPTTEGVNITTPGLNITGMHWELDNGQEVSSSSVYAGNTHYILVIELGVQDGYFLPEPALGEDHIHVGLTTNFKELINERPELRIGFTSQSLTKVKVTFNGNGGTSSLAYRNVYQGSALGTLPTAARKGYTFLGWYTAKTGGEKLTEDSIIGSNITLYARWTLTKYKITYNLNGGTNNSSNPATYTMNTANITLKNPTKKGYKFLGWYSDANFKTKVTVIKKGSVGNKNLYAKWTPITYKIAFNKNGGTGTMTAQTGLKYNKAYYIKANSFKRKGYSFAGWNTKANGTGVSYTNKQAIKNLSAKDGATVTLYAQWKKVKYTITYNLNGGTNNSSNPAAYYVTSAVTFKNPAKKGYRFLGWYTDSKYKTKITAIKKGTVGNKTLYAKWTPVVYSIKFNANGGKGTLANQTGLKYNTAYNLKANTFKKSGYTFVGWNTKADGSGTKYANKASVKNLSATNGGVVTLYAQWEKTDKIQALNRAKTLIKTSDVGWSYNRVVFELEDVEKYSHAAAVYAADNCGADWNYEALRWAKAQLIHTYYSRADLLYALVEYDWFTSEQAEYAVNNVLEALGTTWNVQAVRAAKVIEELTPYSRQKLYQALLDLGFTESEANHGVDNADIIWNEQAVKAALNYLQFTPTYDELVSWLEEDELFTHEQAVVGATAALEMYG